MSGGGGGLTSVLPIAAGLAATVLTDGAAAPMLADSFGVSAGTAAALGGAGVGALAGGATSALTGGNFGQGAISGGLAGLGAGATGSFMGATDALGSSGALIGGMGQAGADAVGALPGAENLGTQSLLATGASAPGGLAPSAGGTLGLSNGVLTTPADVSQAVANGQMTMAQANAYGQGLTSGFNGLSQVPNAVSTGLFGSGITGTQAMLGLGGLGLYNTIQNQNKKYGTIPSSTVNAVPADLNYAPNLPARPMNLTPTYADGGQVDQQSLNGGPVPQKLMDNATGQNMMFPQPGIHSSHFTNPTNTPTPGNILTTATDTRVDPYTGQQLFAAGGIAGLNAFAGGGNLGGYSDGGQYLQGPGDGMSDSIPAHIDGKQPARLADSEFVIPADVVSHLGNGSSDAGAKKLYSMMDKVRMARTGRRSQGKEINADKYLPA
jgi:hypothetical protein